ASMRDLAMLMQSGGPERRFIAMLGCSLVELPNHLRHAVSLLNAKSIGVDWCQLLADIRHWENENRWIQTEWARAFWGHAPETMDSPRRPEASRSSEEE